jgi:hypothetical protein
MTFHKRSSAFSLALGLLMWALLAACGTAPTQAIPTPNAVIPTLAASALQPTAVPAPSVSGATELMRTDGILYIRVEYFQAQYGTPPWSDEPQPMTTTYEWWIDAANPWRARHIITLWLNDGPHITQALGSNGKDAWWQINWSNGIVAPVTLPGLPPFLGEGQTTLSMADWTGKFSGGKRYAQSLQQGVAKELAQGEQAPWGKVITVEEKDASTGDVYQATYQVASPNILLEQSQIYDGVLVQSHRLTHWVWLDANDLSADFWMTPPAGIPIGP